MLKKLLIIIIAACLAGVALALVVALTDSQRLAENSVQSIDQEAQRHTPKFVNIASKLGLPATERGVNCSANSAAVAWIDLDRQGGPELILGSYTGWTTIWQVDSQSAEPIANLGLIPSATGLAVADYDNDGWDDLLVSTQKGARLYNNRSGRLVDVTASSGIKPHKLGMTAAWGDMNRDGLLDLALTQGNNCANSGPKRGFHFGQPRLYLQTSAGRFRQSHDLLAEPVRPALGQAVGWTDLNDDGWLDLYFANDNIAGADNQAWRNEKGKLVPGFKSSEIGINSMGLGLGDLNRDSRMDLAISNIAPVNTLINKGTRFQRDRLQAYSYNHLPITWGLIVEDFNNDGWEDIWSAAGGLEGQGGKNYPVFFLNLGPDRDLIDVGKFSGIKKRWRGRSPAIADLNNDGLMDLVMASLNDKPAFFINKGSAIKGNWLNIRLEGNPALNSPRSACGARAWLTVKKITWMREMGCGSEGFLSSSERMLHFGTGNLAGSGRLKIRWPGGQAESHQVNLNSEYSFVQQGP